jgi:hypothetical protein
MERHTPTQGETQMTASSNAYRAAYWISADGQSDFVLTSEDMSKMSDTDLTAAALCEIHVIGLIREDGDRIVIGDWSE